MRETLKMHPDVHLLPFFFPSSPPYSRQVPFTAELLTMMMFRLLPVSNWIELVTFSQMLRGMSVGDFKKNFPFNQVTNWKILETS